LELDDDASSQACSRTVASLFGKRAFLNYTTR
jgi:hypothetical protein